MIRLHYHPFSRAATCVWMLEEVGVPYEIRFWDMPKGEHKSPEILQLNPMGKLPVLEDGEVALSEVAAIGLYLADRYAAGKLAPALDAPARAAYLRWSLFAPSVIEPGAMAKLSNWTFRASNAGFGDYESMLATMEFAIGEGPFLLGETFSMADVIFGGTLRYMLSFKMVEARERFTKYVDRLNQREAYQRASEKNAALMAKHGVAV